MADLNIIDSAGATGDIQFRDDSPLAIPKLSQLKFSNIPVIEDFDKPIDQTSIKSADIGVKLDSPSMLLGDAGTLTLEQNVSGGLSIRKAAEKHLFDGDGFAPPIDISPDECWIGLEIDVSLDAKLAATVDGFGVCVEDLTKLGLTTYTRLQRSAGAFPALKDSLKTAVENYSIALNADAVCKQQPGTVHATDLSGTVKFSGSYSVPIAVNALASAELAFNHEITIQPTPLLKVGGEIALQGEFIVRSYKTSGTELCLGVYKKKGTTFTVTFTAAEGLEGEVGTTDVLGKFFSAVAPKIDPQKAGITGDNAAELKSALTECLNHSFSVMMNVACSAGITDEAAVLYSITVGNQVDGATAAAISAALRGDWTQLDSLPNATRLRNIVGETKDFKQKIAINLLGFYSATSVEDYVKSCTILHDSGQLVVTDKAKASRIAVSGTSYAAAPDRLRKALAEGFLATMTYTAAKDGKGTLSADLTTSQTYFRYAASMSSQEMQDQILFGTALNLFLEGTLDGVVAASPSFNHVKVSASAKYDGDAAKRLFFADIAQRTPRTRDELERIGRQVKVSLLNPTETGGVARINVLNNDAIWSAMDDNGNVQDFGTIPELRSLGPNDLADVGADWKDIRDWTNSMLQVAPKLKDLLAAAEQSTAPNPETDSNFVNKRKALQNALGSVAQNAHSAFGDGWGLAVMSALSGGTAQLTLDIGWNSTTEHYESAPKVAAAP